MKLPYLKEDEKKELSFDNLYKNLNCNYLVIVEDRKYSQVYYKIKTDENQVTHHENEKIFDKKFIKVNNRDEFKK